MTGSGPRVGFAQGETLSDGDYRRLSEFIRIRSGVRLAPSKKVFLEGRLRRRLRQLHFSSFTEYCRYLFDGGNADTEEAAILDAVTTHKTDFFRELHHFRFLAEVALPALLDRGGERRGPLRLWSAGCSNGAEPYSLAMVCQEFSQTQTRFAFQVTGTDISTSMLEMAQRAVYPHAMVDAIPLEWRKRYLLRARDADCDDVRIAPELRKMVTFGYTNLIWDAYPIEGQVDILFCRNVLIYFDKATQAAVVSNLCRYLINGGYLVLGHSENITGIPLPLRMVAPTVFVRERSS